MTAAETKLVVIGNGMVGQRFLETLVPASAKIHITVLCAEPRPAYDRVHLTSFFSGKSADDLSLVPPDFFARNHIEFLCGARAVEIDREAKRVRTQDGREIEYDALVLATGSYPFVPPIPGREREGCFVYRTIEDLEAIRAAAGSARVGAVIGGGLLGLEAAKALRDLNLETHVIEFAPRLMALQVDEAGGALLRKKIEALGVRVHTGKNTKCIELAGRTSGDAGLDAGADASTSAGALAGASASASADACKGASDDTSVPAGQCAAMGARHRMCFSDGSALETDLIIFSAGIRPCDELARSAGLNIGARGGIVIDDACRTSDPSIYAIGECALWRGKTFGLVAPGYQMAQVVAARLTGHETAVFEGADMSTKLKLMGVDVASIGDAHCALPGSRAYAFTDDRRDIYKKLVISDDGKRVIGAVLVGDADCYGSWLQMMLNGMDVPEHPEELLFSKSETALPNTAQICSCNNVSKAALCAAIDEGCTTLGALKSKTKAASTCGGCAPLVTQVLKAELAKKGVAVNNHLCEHFAYSRQQLFHLVRIGGLRSFETVLEKHGQGRGCDICKPTVASILASCWNEFVLARDKAPLQDTNDYFLANMQKDGTYSIVPRVPGGEMTPDKLIVIGAVAKKYGLYTKITGGQRIDLFGARAHELPLIWSELIEAGFESGHAYGKAMRTVKSCVGSTWCRYGVQDSVNLAIDLENRYKGLRAPHKIKLAVSGCTRECAEARSKDVGVIATEKGWNLYVCGNGGMKPRHADLLAVDLDTETLIRTIDRFFMFYIRTADRLQRTSTWLDNLEGGLEYVRQVVCEDKLGIAHELEADMARVIAGYECEWKKAVEDPATLRRFRHFVTTDTQDPWRFVCNLDEVLPNTGACALVNGKQIAIFRVDDSVYAIENRDPATGMDVLSRGIVGDIKGECVVASPLFKHHYSLKTGRCIEDESLRANVYAARITDGQVWLNTQKRRLIVIGNGMAGMRTVEELLDIAPAAYEIVVFGAEPHGNYNRILLSPVLSGEKSAEEILIHSADWYAKHGITLHTGDPVVAIDRRRRIVRSQQGRELSYDRLLIATGSKPWVPALKGIELPGVVAFRDLKDVDLMLEAARRYRKAAVIGGGLLGLEAANGLLRRGMDVTVVHLPDSLMERQLDPAAADLLKVSLESRGIKFLMGARTREILGDERATGLSFEDGSTLDADLIVMTAGVRPNIELAKQAGVQCERGVLVTDTMQTFDPSIYAVGECVQHRNITFGLVAPLWDQARVCAMHLAEQGFSRFKGSIVATQLKVTGIELYSAGEFIGEEGDETIVLQDENRGVYKRIVIRDNQVRGAVLYGDAGDGNWYFDLMSARQDIGPLRDQLLFGPAFAAPEQ